MSLIEERRNETFFTIFDNCQKLHIKKNDSFEKSIFFCIIRRFFYIDWVIKEKQNLYRISEVQRSESLFFVFSFDSNNSSVHFMKHMIHSVRRLCKRFFVFHLDFVWIKHKAILQWKIMSIEFLFVYVLHLHVLRWFLLQFRKSRSFLPIDEHNVLCN